jgi:hypothetical protein
MPIVCGSGLLDAAQWSSVALTARKVWKLEYRFQTLCSLV